MDGFVFNLSQIREEEMFQGEDLLSTRLWFIGKFVMEKKCFHFAGKETAKEMGFN